LPEAKEAFIRAVNCKPNETQAADWIKVIDQILAQNKGKKGGLDRPS
jgi:hypothetical protein